MYSNKIGNNNLLSKLLKREFSCMPIISYYIEHRSIFFYIFYCCIRNFILLGVLKK